MEFKNLPTTKMKNYFYVYIHTKPGTDEVFYVGRGQKSRASATNSRNSYWKNIVNKHGGFDYEIIENNLTNEEANLLEQYWISQFKAWNFKLVNMTLGGDGAYFYPNFRKGKTLKEIYGEEKAEKIIKKQSISHLGIKNNSSTKFKKGQIGLRKGVEVSKETRDKMSISKKGKTTWNKGIPMSEESKQKMINTKKRNNENK